MDRSQEPILTRLFENGLWCTYCEMSGRLTGGRFFAGRGEEGRVEEPRVAAAVKLRAGAASGAAALGLVTGGLDEAGDREDLAVEVACVQLLAPDGLVDLAEFGDRKRRPHERRRQRGVLKLGPGSLHPVGEDLRVIKGERARRTQSLGNGDRDPPGVGSASARRRLRHCRGECQVGDGDNPHPWVTARSAVAAKLLKVGGAELRTGFFCQRPGGGLRQVLLNLLPVRAGTRADEAAGQRPVTLVRLL